MATQARRPTASDVARLAGVSQSAVSRVFSDGGTVAAAKRARVVAAAKSLGYQPNTLARSLITGRSGLIGWISPDRVVPFYERAVLALSRDLAAHDLRLLLVHAPDTEATERAVPVALRYQVDALIVASATVTSGIIETCQLVGTPVIQFGRTAAQSRAHSVVSDNFGGGGMAADHFARQGRRRWAFVGGPIETSSARDRSAGFSAGAQRFGADIVARHFVAYAYAAGRAIAPAIVEARPEAIFCASDAIAIGLLDGLTHDHGVRIPDDMGVIGFDDIDAASHEAYALTTLRQDPDRLAARTTAALLEILTNAATPPSRQVVPVTLVRRRTA